MKLNFIKIVLATILMTSNFYAQESESFEIRVGYRIKKEMDDCFIYMNKDGSPDFNNSRKLNYRVYFRKINTPTKIIKDKTYQLITIPGTMKELDQKQKDFIAKNNTDPRNGSSISEYDYDQNFWVDITNIEGKTQEEYTRYENDFFSGALTAPFKYRLESGSVKESIIDGSFNVSPFLGWKWHLSKTKPYYFSIIGFTGFTTLNYTSSDNKGITDASKKETGAALTYGGGVVLRFGKVSPGLIVGWDHSTGNLGDTYIYKDHPWVSFSVNFEFFEPKKKDDKSN